MQTGNRDPEFPTEMEVLHTEAGVNHIFSDHVIIGFARALNLTKAGKHLLS